MIELTVPQPLATLAVEGVVTVLVVDWSPCVSRRWPAEVTIRSSRVEPEYRHGPLLNAGWQVSKLGGMMFLAHRGRWWPSYDIPRGEVLGSVTVEAAVPILGVDDIIEESCGWVSVFHRSAYLLLQSESGEHRHSDISGQLAFQDFPVGNTALILTPTDEMETE